MNKYDWTGIVIAVVGVFAAIVCGIVPMDQRLDALESQRQTQVPATVLVGAGCEGPSNHAVAFEEDDLPRCRLIERHELKSQRP